MASRARGNGTSSLSSGSNGAASPGRVDAAGAIDIHPGLADEAEGKQGWAPQAAEGGAGGEDCPSAKRLSDRHGFLGDSDEGTVAVGHIVETEGGAPRDVVGAAHLGPAAHTMEGDGSTRERGEAPVAGFKRKRKLLLAARTLKVEEPAVRDLAYADRRDGAHTTLKTLRSRDKDCTGNLEETLIGLPISAVLNLHRQVVQCQARVRGNITRKRLARGKQLDQIGSGVAMHIARNTSWWPHENEIVHFFDSTQISAATCSGEGIQVVDGKVSIVISHRFGGETSHSINSQRKPIAASSKTDGNPDASLEHLSHTAGHSFIADSKGGLSKQQTCAGYFKFASNEMSADLDHAARYLCLDFHADDDTCQHLAAREIASAFLHLTLSARDLKNTHILLGQTDSFYTISRIDDAGSLAESSVVVYTSPVVRHNLNPKWPTVRIPLQNLTMDHSAARCQLLFEVWDKHKHFHTGQAHRIGVVRCSLFDIHKGAELPLELDDAALRKLSHGKLLPGASPEQCPNVGTLVVEKQKVEYKYFTLAGQVKPSLLRYYAEHVWNLPTPEVLISIASGLAEYTLESSIEDKLLYDMMDMTLSVGTWLISNGAKHGFAKAVGVARGKHAVTTPLIGICSVPRSAGGCEHEKSMPSTRAEWIDHVDAHFDRNHSHFILAANTDEVGLQEAKLRSDFEACVGQGASWSQVQQHILRTLRENELRWSDENAASVDATVQASAAKTRTANTIHCIKVCVQGGLGTIRTMLHTVQQHLPVLLVRGTGKGTDLVADCVCLKFSQGHCKHLDRNTLSPKQQVLCNYLDQLLQTARTILPNIQSAEFPRDPLSNNTNGHFSNHDYVTIVQFLKHSLGADGGSCSSTEAQSNQVLSAYDVSLAAVDVARKVMIHVLLTAKTKFCWVYDLDVGGANLSRAPDPTRVMEGLERACDFHGSMLHCLINGLQHSPYYHHEEIGGTATDSLLLNTQIMLAIRWKRPDALHWLLRRLFVLSEKRVKARYTVTHTEFQGIIDRCLQISIQNVNEAAVMKLLEYGARLSAYCFAGTHDQVLAGGAAPLWEDLIRTCKTDPSRRHMHTVLSATKRTLRAQASLHKGFTRQQVNVDIGQLAFLHSTGWEAYAALECLNARQNRNRGAQSTDLLSRSQGDQMHLSHGVKALQRVVLFQSFLRELMGERFYWHFGMLDSPTFDIFVWFVVCNRTSMAMIFWQRVKHPILSAILGAFMLRKLASHHAIKHNACAQEMRRSADLFETLAIKVFQSSSEDDAEKTLAMLEQPVPFWPGDKLLDLAYKARCTEFVSVCCPHAINRRFAGDLVDAEHIVDLPLGFSLVISTDTAVLLVIISSLGLLAPLVLTYRPPPKHPNFRYSTQRRLTPLGYPYLPYDNPTLAKLLKGGTVDQGASSPKDITGGYSRGDSLFSTASSPTLLRGRMNVVRSKGSAIFNTMANALRRSTDKSAAQLMMKLKGDRWSYRDDQSLLEELWAPTFGYCERLLCFYRAPVTLFWLTSLYRGGLAAISIFYLVKLQTDVFHATHVGGTGFNAYEKQITNSTAGILRQEFSEESAADWIQFFLAWHYLANMLVMLVRFCVRDRGSREFVRSIWPSLEVAGGACFIWSFALKHGSGGVPKFYDRVLSQLSSLHSDTSAEHYHAHQQRQGLVFLLQGVSAAFLTARLIRVLSVKKQFGKFVLTYLSMFSALKYGVVVAFILWTSFAMARIGLTMLCQTYPKYLIGSEAFGDENVVCSNSFENTLAALFQHQADWAYDGQMTELWVLYLIVLRYKVHV